MANKKLQRKKEELRSWMESKGFEQDSYGHMKKTLESGTQLRFKFQKTSIRAESKPATTTDGEKWTYGWMKRWGAYYKDIVITEEDKIKPLKVIK